MKKLFFLLMIFSLNCFASDFITAKQAVNYKNKTKTVCAKVVQVVKHNTITYVNFDKKYPNQSFYLYISEPDGYIDLTLTNGKKVCSHGKIELYKNKPMQKNPKSIMIMQ
ncbi:MAG: hypothetical protein II291_03825 [Succinivibrio sp.]|nr:hypothetical protein [Succinivibrio sp.]